MHSKLTPRLAAELADLAYAVLDGSADIRRLATPDIQQQVDFQQRVTARTGGYILNRETGFAAMGIGKGQYGGDAIITIRGTQMTSGHDWATNAQIGLTGSSGGQTVHAGFCRAFASMRPQFEAFLAEWRASHPGRVVHCVGHSLGGALATLLADWIGSSPWRQPVYLYTFGAPRVGLGGFALANTSRVSANHRCTHGADPVPKVPLWPFIHSPFKGTEFRLDSAHGGFSKLAHLMDPKAGAVPGYLRTANKNSWDALQRQASRNLEAATTLDYAKRHQASFNEFWLDILSAALITLLKKAGYLGVFVAQSAIGVGATFYDLMAQTLAKIAEAATSAADEVRGLLGHMLVFAGAAVTTVKDLTYATIRAIFDLMLRRLYEGVREALKRTWPN